MAVAMEWFNPLVDCLFRENIAVSEMICDEAAVEGKTKAEKAGYISCMIKASEKPDDSKIITVSFGTSKSLLEERIKRIMGKNKKNVWKKGSAVLIVMICCVLVSIPVFAYQLPKTLTDPDMSRQNAREIFLFHS